MSKKVEVEATGHVKHDGRYYAPPRRFKVTEEEANRLVDLDVVKRLEAKETEPDRTTAAGILELNAKDAATAIAAVTDREILAKIIETDTRKTVIEAARARYDEVNRPTGTQASEPGEGGVEKAAAETSGDVTTQAQSLVALTVDEAEEALEQIDNAEVVAFAIDIEQKAHDPRSTFIEAATDRLTEFNGGE